MLARVTREDIDLYKKCREGVVKFNIAMADLSAKIVREFHPAIKMGVDILNRFSGWVKENEHNIVRFFMVAAGVITAVFIPALVKMGLALLWNPLTGLIIALGALILVLDDLITYARGGRSAFAEFWAKFGTPEEVKQKLIAFLEKCKKLLADYLPLIVKIVGALVGLSAVRGVFYLIDKALGGVGKALGVVGKALGIFLRHPALLFLIASAYFIYQRWDGMVEGMKALIADLISVWKKSVDWLANYIAAVVDGWTALTDKCKSIYSGMVDWTADYIGKIAQGWKDLTGDLSAAYDKAVNFTVDLMGKAVNGVKDLRTKAVNALAGMIESLAGVLSRTWEGIKDGFNALVDDLLAAWKRSPLYTMFSSIIDGVNAAKKALGIGTDEEQKTGGIGAVGGIAAAVANTFDLGGLWGNAKDFLSAKFSAVPNVNQQTSAVTNSVGKQHNGDVNIDNSQNITVNGNVGDPAELAETMSEHRTTADLSDSGTYLN
jgi:phage-related protein